MVIIDTDTVHNHATMMVIFDTARITTGTVMCSRQFGYITFFTVIELSVVLHFIIYHLTWVKIVVENKGIE